MSRSEPTLDGLLGLLVPRLEAGGFEFAVVGAFARNAWARTRTTTDIDFGIVLDLESLARLVALAGELGLRERRPRVLDEESGLPHLLLLALDGHPWLKVDFLVAQTPFEREAIGRRRTVPLLGIPCPVVPPEAVLVYKLIAWRDKDRDDAREVLRTQRTLGAALDLEFVRRWAGEFGIAARWTALEAEE